MLAGCWQDNLIGAQSRGLLCVIISAPVTCLTLKQIANKYYGIFVVTICLMDVGLHHKKLRAEAQVLYVLISAHVIDTIG